jgi:Tol biopolymer transport system component/actin-like ATPase involved in cell morphogenesis
LGYCLGVDVGTTFTAAAIARDGRAEMAVLGSRTAAIPTVIFISADEQEVLVGDAARRRLASDPTRVAREFKRRLGDATPIFVGETPRSAESLIAVVLRWVVDHVTEQEGGTPDQTVVTHPANWGAYRRELLDHAIHQADIGSVRTITEPEAAAVYYASTERVEPGALIAVYDLGGGTFDAALLRRTDAGFELVGTPEGIEHLGGIDVDEAIFEHVRRALAGKIDALDPDDPATTRALIRLREECTDAKETLSFDSRATVPVLLPGLQSEVGITRTELEPMIRPLLSDTIAALRRAFAAANVEPDAVQAILLVGGSSRIPLVAEMLTSELGRPVALDAHPKHAIALGAALTAAGAVGVTAAPPALPPTGAPEPSTAAAPTAAPSGTPPTDTSTGDIDVPAAGEDGAAPPGWKRRAPLIAAVVAILVFAAFLLTRGGGSGAASATTTTTVAQTTTTAAVTLPTGPPLSDETMVYTQVVGTAEGGHWNVRAINADGSGDHKIVDDPALRAELPALSPDRRTVAYTVVNGPNWELWVAASNGDGAQRIVSDMASDARATWSPDGKKLAYVSDRDGHKDIYVHDIAAGTDVNITKNADEEGDPAWSPDGTNIAFWAVVDGNKDVYVMPATGGERTRLTNNPGEDADPAWSPDGNRLAFSCVLNGTDWEVCLLDSVSVLIGSSTGGDSTAAHSPPLQLTQNDSDDQDPTWSPSGLRIAFESKRDGPDINSAELYVMNPDSSGQTRFTMRDGFDGHASWSAGPSS